MSLPATATEGDGVLAGQGRVSIVQARTNTLSVALASSNTNKVVVPPTVVIPAGATNVNFNITIVDNAAAGRHAVPHGHRDRFRLWQCQCDDGRVRQRNGHA